jgi:oxygen-independent coproporphyrinogen-3 oxidase
MRYTPGMSFGIYFHIPFCLQKCHYCDFATLPAQSENEMSEYTKLLLREIDVRHSAFFGLNDKELQVSTIYFGGGTPSLLSAEDILAVVKKLSNVGFKILQNAEITIEINPGTVDQKKLDLYRAAGVNRFSVGVQTFNDKLLEACGREHNANDSRRTLNFLKENTINYSFDLLFGLPKQNLTMLGDDLNEIIDFQPPHVSAYLMTLTESHFLNIGRAPDTEQAEMFDLIDSTLAKNGWDHYEISNYAKPGFESKHNMGYWNDTPYWGIGLSAHSYVPQWASNGVRFWNPKNLDKYKHQILTPLWSESPEQFLIPPPQVEKLQKNEAMTDYLHTQLRKKTGVSKVALRSKFPAEYKLIEKRLENLLKKEWVEFDNSHYKIAQNQRVLANNIFFELTFLAEDLAGLT